MAETERKWYWRIEWWNPYTQPPNGEPRCLGMQVTRPGQQPTALMLILPPFGTGYSLAVNMPTRTGRTLPLETKQKIRRRNLERRIERYVPLFKEDALRDALQANPEYFGRADG